MKRKTETNKMVLIAIMADLGIILYLLNVNVGNIRLTFYGLPLMLTGMLFGPKIGGLAGLVVGFITQLILWGIGPTTILWMAAPFLWGFISGVIAKKVKKDFSPRNIILIVFATSLTVTLVNSGALILDDLILGKPVEFIFIELIMRFTTSIITACINTTLLIHAIKRVEKIEFLKL